MRRALVLSGAGALGLQEAAAIDHLSDLGFQFPCVGGVSAGAINAAGLAFGLPRLAPLWDAMLTSGKLEDFAFPGPFKVFGILHGPGHGMLKGEEIRKALEGVFGSLSPNSPKYRGLRMGDSPAHLRIVVSNLSRRRAQVIDSRNEAHKRLFVVDVLMCSLAVPFLVRAQQLDPQSPVLYADGGIARNVPSALWDDKPETLTLVVKFAENEAPRKVDSLKEMIAAVFDLVRDGAEDELSAKPGTQVLALRPAGNALDFTQTEEACARMEAAGLVDARAFTARLIASELKAGA